MVDEIRDGVNVQEAQGENTAHEEFEPDTMEAALKMYGGAEDIHRGKVVEGTVVDAQDDGWLVNVGYKCEGFLPRKEWTHRVLVETVPEPSVGDKVRVQVTNLSQGEEAQLSLSRWRSEFDERWNRLEEELAKNEIIQVKGLRKVKGGLIVDCFGIEGFIPISHLAEDGRNINPGRLIDQTFSVKVIERDRRKRRFVLSRRSILDEEIGAEREKFYESVHEGDIVEGDVSSITSFGVFVNLGVIEGLVHISELAWHRNAKPKEIVNKGDHIKVKVIGIDKENNKISLSLRQTEANPWDTVAERWKPGTVTEGTVTNLTDFGAFVEIEPGIEGLIHIGDLSWTRIKHPKEVLKKGQKIEVVVQEIDTERKRISLGYKQLHDPWRNIGERFAAGQDIQVKVVRLADFGAFVELEEGVEGLIHISELSRQRVERPQDVLQEGQEVTARILEIDSGARRIRLSLRALEKPSDDEPQRHRDRDGGDDRGERRPRRREGGDRGGREQHKTQLVIEDTPITIGEVLSAQMNNNNNNTDEGDAE